MNEGTVTPDRIIGRFRKSNTADIQVSLVPWEGTDYLDIREVIPDPEGVTYTRKGVRLRVDLVIDLVELLGKVQADITGELPPE